LDIQIAFYRNALAALILLLARLPGALDRNRHRISTGVRKGPADHQAARGRVRRQRLPTAVQRLVVLIDDYARNAIIENLGKT
jgi:hypothetical protein